MRKHIGFFRYLLASLLGCATAAQDGPETQRTSAQAYQTVCSALSSKSAHVENSLVTVKGDLVVHEHGALLRDSKCRDKTIFLRYQDLGPYFQFCDSDRLSREFGCPAGKNGPIVTV